MRVQENLTLYIGGQTVEIVNDGIKAYKDWTDESRTDLKEVMEQMIEKGETTGWIPYANFEASLTWKLKIPESKL